MATEPAPAAPADRPAPAFPWVGVVVSLFSAAAIAMVVGVPAYHFLADQSWREATSSALRWAGLAMLGVALVVVLRMVTRKA